MTTANVRPSRTRGAAPDRPRLLDAVRDTCRRRHLAASTERVYVGWIARFVRHANAGMEPSDWVHPADLPFPGDAARDFLSHLAQTGRAASTQNQALNAIAMLYNRVLRTGIDIGPYDRAKRPKTQPRVASRDDLRRTLAELDGVPKLAVLLMYGCGLRRGEVVALRVKDIRLDERRLDVRRGKGAKDRTVPLPTSAVGPMRDHLETVARRHRRELAAGRGASTLPGRLAAKLPAAPTEWGWQYVFPGRQWGRHVSPSTVAKALTRAASRAGVTRRLTCHTLRHSFATHLLEGGEGSAPADVVTIRDLLGHASIRTTAGYLAVADRPGPRSPLDVL